MTRIFLKLGVALVTFTIGVYVTAIYSLYQLPDPILPPLDVIPQRHSCFPGLSTETEKSIARKEYFPLSGLSWLAFYPWSDRYSRHLNAMDEHPLAALENEDESYRFLWLRTFHKSVVVHVWRRGQGHYMVVKRLNGRGGYSPGTFDLYWAHSLSENEWDAFMMHLEHSNYWLMPIRDDVILFDGAHWVMEGYREGRYHVVDRQSPDEGAYRDACLFLLRQSGLLAETPADEIY